MMDVIIHALSLLIVGILLLWFGYSLFFGPKTTFYPAVFPWRARRRRTDDDKGIPGQPQVCPLCSVRLVKGQRLKAQEFPSVSAGFDHLMYIYGCFSCLETGLPRRCPICESSLNLNDFLVTRLFERPRKKNHVHILGCNHCRGKGDFSSN